MGSGSHKLFKFYNIQLTARDFVELKEAALAYHVSVPSTPEEAYFHASLSLLNKLGLLNIDAVNFNNNGSKKEEPSK